MSYLDTYYRAFAGYEKSVREDRDAERWQRAISLDADLESIELVQTECHIEDDWIEAIEQGLEHIGKAIAQERQFILSNGEVVPIEKVKAVSRETVVHLSKHSNFLKKVKDSRDIMPEKLYTVERLSDFAVYENRFLYMLLCYLKDFITYRLNKIIDLTNKYSGSMRMKKTVNADGRKLCFEASLDEEIFNDVLVSERNPVKDKIAVINGLLSTVMIYLATPLMEEAGKAAKLHPPITETNVLRMDKDFKGAMQLYHFVTAYTADGFTAEEKRKTLSPFGEGAEEQMSQGVALLSFLTYKHGMGAESYLKARFAEEEERRKKLAEEELLQKLEKLRRQIRQSGVGAEEYMLLLEQRNRSLESAEMQLKTTQGLLEKSEKRVSELTAQTEEKDRQLAAQEEAHRAETERLQAECESRIQMLQAQHAEETERLRAEHEERCRVLEEQIAALERKVQEERAAGEEKLAAQRRELEERIESAARDAQTQRERAAQAEQAVRDAEEKNTVLLAKYNAIRSEHGLFTEQDDFTSQINFDELERQYKVFTRFFKSEWKKAKKRIRGEILRGITAKDGKKRSDEGQAAVNVPPTEAAQSTEAAQEQEHAVQPIEEVQDGSTQAEEDVAKRDKDEE